MLVFFSNTEISLNRSLAVGTMHPVTFGAPGKFSGLGCASECLPRAKQGFDIHAIVDFLIGHRSLLIIQIQYDR
jgi:hypothetical protein